jgi:hypothetical protein
MLCLVDVFSNKQSTLLWVLNVLLFSHDEDVIQGFLKKNEKKNFTSDGVMLVSDGIIRYAYAITDLYKCCFCGLIDEVQNISFLVAL